VFIIDDMLLAPARGLFWVFREIHKAVEEDRAQEADRITDELRSLYLLLEAGKLSEGEFDSREKELLDRLDRIQEE